MNNKRKLYLFLLLLPIIDVLTSITEKLNLNIPSLGIIIKSVFLGIMILYLIISSTSKYKKMSLYYLIAIFLYIVLFFITKINYLNLSLFVIELKYMIKILFYPISLITMICYFDDKKLSKEELSNVLLKSFLIYLLFIIIPFLTKTGFNSYMDGSYGSSGWFYAANEMAIILIALFPFSYMLLKKSIVFVIVPIISVLLISTLGTKVSMIGLYIVSLMIFVFSIFYRKNNKVDKKLIISCLLIFISVVIVFNNSKILKNLDISIKVQEKQNEIDKGVLQIPDSDKTKDSFLYILMNKYGKAILSDRDIYFNYTYKIYNDNFDINTLLFGVGYSNNKKINNIAITKLIEIDFFDILFHSGLIMSLIVFFPFLYFIVKLFKSKKFNINIVFYTLMIALIFSISCLSGHTFGAPAVSIYLSFYMIFAFGEIGLISLKKTKLSNKVTIYALHLGYGGVEKNICEKANILSNIYDVEIISLYKLYDKPAFIVNPKVKIKYLTNVKPNRNEFKNAVKSKNIKSILKEGFYTVKVLYLKNSLITKSMIECNSKIIISTRAYFSLKLIKNNEYNNIKIAEEHIYHNNNSKYIKKLGFILKYVDYLMPSSDYLKDYYKSIYSKYDYKIKTNKMPIERANKLCDLKKKNIISVGRLSKEKGFADLIEIFSNIESEDWTLTIVGDGDEKENLEALIKDNNLEGKVILTGFLNKEELYKLYENSSLYVMTSFEESFGLVLVEASSFGLPLIAFDSAIGAKEIIQKNGILVSNRDKSVMIKKIKKLMNDISERKLYQKKSLEIYKSYDYTTLKENIISFYQDITNNNIYSTLYKKNKKSCYELIENNLRISKKTFIVTANPETYMLSKKDDEMKSIIYNKENLIVPDGISIVKTASYFGIDLKERITGVDLCSYLLQLADENKYSLYLFGSTSDVIEKLVNVIKEKYSNINILGYSNGYEKDKDAIMKKIVKLNPDICLVALGIPYQEKLINKYIDTAKKGIYVGVGGSFDVLSGTKKRAPKIFIKLNLEWLYRLICEPKRLKRFINSNVKFIFEVRKK